MTIDIITARATIHTTLQTIGLWSQSAEDLILGIGAHESHYQFVQQLGGGPALGYWQMEPATHDDCWSNYLYYRAPLAAKIEALLQGAPISASAMVANLPYAIGMARIRLLRAPEPFPIAGDIEGYAAYWKQWWNTPQGAGTIQEFLDNWQRFIGSGSV
jgi:hypothetical protein